MRRVDLDEVDSAILHALQADARHNTNAEISELAGVSVSTVGKRIDRLEERGIVTGYRPTLDYELAGYPLYVLVVCTASITNRDRLVKEALDIDGVVNVRVMMTGEENVHIRVSGSSNDDITRLARQLDELGLAISDE